EGQEIGEVRRQAGIRRRPFVAIPGADLLADVAAEDPVLERGPERGWDGAAVLDREVGEAAPRVHGVSLERARGARGQAARARAAGVGREGNGRERQVSEELRKKEVRAGHAMEQEGVAADPAEPGTHRPFTLY